MNKGLPDAQLRHFKELQAEIKRLEDALMFYASPDTYFAIGFFPDRPCGEFMDDFSDTDLVPEMGLVTKPGKRARQALGFE